MEFLKDEQEDDVSITNLSLQFFTVPTIAHDLIENHNALGEITDLFTHSLQHQFEDGVLMLETWMEGQLEHLSEFSRVSQSITDMKFILSKAPEKDDWNDNLRKGFMKGMTSIIYIISTYQGLDPNKRETRVHPEYDSIEWEHTYRLSSPMQEVVDNAVGWCKTDKSILIDIIKYDFFFLKWRLPFPVIFDECAFVRRSLTSAIRNDYDKRFSSQQRELVNYETSCGDSSSFMILKYDVLSEEVSTNVPLQRFLADLIPMLNGFGTPMVRHAHARVAAYNIMDEIVDPVLSILTMFAQYDCGMWKKNGGVMHGMYSVYNLWSPSQRSSDLLMLQAALALDDHPRQILAALISRFGLESWVKGGDEHPFEDDQLCIGMADALLSLLLAVVSERYTLGAADISEAEQIRNGVIQQLSAGPMAFSDFRRVIGCDDDSKLQDCLRTVGTLAQSKKDPNKRVFTLKSGKDNFANCLHFALVLLSCVFQSIKSITMCFTTFTPRSKVRLRWFISTKGAKPRKSIGAPSLRFCPSGRAFLPGWTNSCHPSRWWLLLRTLF